jgi:hypothetical protein
VVGTRHGIRHQMTGSYLEAPDFLNDVCRSHVFGKS